METGILGPNPCLTKLWDLRVPSWRRELANLSIWGDLTSPDCSCWEGGGFDKGYGEKYLKERSKGDNFWVPAVEEGRFKIFLLKILQVAIPTPFNSWTTVSNLCQFRLFLVKLSFNGIPVQPRKLPGCALTLVPAVQCKKLSLLLWKAFLKGQYKAGMLWCLSAEVGIFPWEESSKAQMSGTLSCG